MQNIHFTGDVAMGERTETQLALARSNKNQNFWWWNDGECTVCMWKEVDVDGVELLGSKATHTHGMGKANKPNGIKNLEQFRSMHMRQKERAREKRSSDCRQSGAKLKFLYEECDERTNYIVTMALYVPRV